MALTWLTIANLRLAAHCDPRVPGSHQDSVEQEVATAFAAGSGGEYLKIRPLPPS